MRGNKTPKNSGNIVAAVRECSRDEWLSALLSDEVSGWKINTHKERMAFVRWIDNMNASDAVAYLWPRRKPPRRGKARES